MQSSIRHSICLFAMAAACLIPGLTRAQTISATLSGLTPYTFGSVYLQGAGTQSGGVGNLSWTADPSNAAPFNSDFNTYCIDLTEDVYFGNPYTFTLAPLDSAPKNLGGMGDAKATEIETLYGMHYSDTTSSAPSASIDKEAFQLAIWNIIYDTDASVDQGSGTFYAEGNSGLDASAITTADAYLVDAANPNNESRFAVSNLEALVGPNGVQDQIVVNPNLPISLITTAPLPAAAPGGVVLLLTVGFAQWRRRAKLNASEMI